METEIRIIMAALAVFRLAHLVSKEAGPGMVFERARINAGKRAGSSSKFWFDIAELLNCPYCLGVWFAALATIAVFSPTKVGDIGLVVFGLAGAQAFLQRVTEK